MAGDGEAEIKRVYLAPAWRGRGLASLLLQHLETRAARGGFTRLRLETGARQIQALALYQRQGYSRTPNYPPYLDNLDSICFAKNLIRPLEERDEPCWSRLRQELWPDCDRQDSQGELPFFLSGRDRGGQVCRVLVCEVGELVAFAEASLRPYAEGCDSSPVGYLEGWYVQPQWRRCGIGRRLLEAVEEWARGHGCTEMASDTGQSNLQSRAAHARLGFTEEEVLVHMRKPL